MPSQNSKGNKVTQMKQDRIIAIDPGPVQSAWLIYDTCEQRPTGFRIDDNEQVLSICNHFATLRLVAKDAVNSHIPAVLAVEMVACYGMPVGKDVFDTCVWIGRFVQAWGSDFEYVYRRDVKLYLCNSMRAKDGNIRQSLIDRFGGSKQKAIGLKASPGPLYGIKKDIWSALAIAITQTDKIGRGNV